MFSFEPHNSHVWADSFSECFPNMIGRELTPEERTEYRESFKNIYGFDPEN